MKTLTRSAEPLKNLQYSLTSQSYVHSCAPYLQYFRLIRDVTREQSWETFGIPALEAYFLGGLDKFQVAFSDFSNLTKTTDIQQTKQLLFMLESLIHAKSLILELEQMNSMS